MRESYGDSNEFIKSLSESTQNREEALKNHQQETKVLASCNYELNTLWGQQIGFWYNCVVEDYFTGFMLHCSGWTSVFCNPPKPAFLGNATTSLNDVLVQGRRWNSGLVDVCLSRFCPLFYGLPRMPLSMTMCYAYLAFQPLYCFPALVLASIPQICLLNGVQVYPKVSSSWFLVYVLVFLSSLLKGLWENLDTGGTFQSWWNEWRVWMMKSVTSYFYGCLDYVVNGLGMGNASFTPTNKVPKDEQFKRYQMGIFDFQTSTAVLAPLVTLVILNIISFLGGVARVSVSGRLDDMFGQILLSAFILLVNNPLIEGMTTRKDSGRVPSFVTIQCFVLALFVLLLGSTLLLHKS